jgi:glycosyltransferase involved in cell wall biosynthesis
MEKLNNLSACLVCYNEDKVIRRTLECLSELTDEIVVFDSFSTDTTNDILKEFNCKIYQHEFDNHRDQKNRAIEKCTRDWILLLDSDEYLDEKLMSNIKNMINNSDGIDCFGVPRKNYLDGEGPTGFPDYQSRIFRSYCRHWQHPFHHRTDGNAKKHVWTPEYGTIIHDKTWNRQERQNRLYYSLRPGDYAEKPRGAENIVINPEAIKDPENVNAYRDYLSKVKEL